MIPAIASILAVLAVAWILAYHRANAFAWTAALAAGAAYMTWFTSEPLAWIGAAWAAVALFAALSIVKPLRRALVTGTIFGIYKAELIHRKGPWRSLEDVEFATLEWVDWFNNRRLLEPLGYLPPAEFEDAYYRSQETPAMVVGLT